MTKPTFSLSRRDFLRTSVLAASTLALPLSSMGAKPRLKTSADKLNLACIGSGGKGRSDMEEMFRKGEGENIVALCDVDQGNLDGAAKIISPVNPNVRLYRDFRKLFDEEKDLDGVTVSTPDHMHSTIALMAMERGLHVYCQKPLCRTISEARAMRDAAAKHGVITQMGNQGSAGDELRRTVEVVQAGVIGTIRKVYIWSNRPIWPQGLERPAGEDEVPANLDWNLWLGVAPKRPYKKDVYAPFKWRGWYDFGTGALGDMACHTMNLTFRALKLGYATEVEAETSDKMLETYPKSSKIRFEFPAREGMAPVQLWWIDGGPKPEADITKHVSALFETLPGSGCLMIGDKGEIFSGGDYGNGNYLKLNEDAKYKGLLKHEAIVPVPVTVPRCKVGHYREWVEGCKGGPKPYSSFDIAAYLTEIMLVGCVAIRAQKKLEWDGPNMRAKNADVSQFVVADYRKGW
jgi:hypothetical protein